VSTIKVDTYQTRGGASEIAIDKLKGVTAAGSMLVVGEGGTNTTNLQQGLLKTWINLNGTGTIATRVSNNVASITDNGTGDCTVTFTVAFGGNHYTFSGGLSSTADRAILILDNGVNLDAASARLQTIYDGDTKIDCAVVTIQFAGDLA